VNDFYLRLSAQSAAKIVSLLLRRKEEGFPRGLFGTTALPLLAALASGKTLKSRPDTCLA
jgi:hypothetical protein